MHMLMRGVFLHVVLGAAGSLDTRQASRQASSVLPSGLGALMCGLCDDVDG